MTRFERVPTIYILSKNKENITIFHLKIIIFTAVKYYSILYGRVFVMIKQDLFYNFVKFQHLGAV